MNEEASNTLSKLGHYFCVEYFNHSIRITVIEKA